VNSALEEINFWSALEHALTNVDQNLKSKEIEFTKQLLKATRRNVAYNQLTTTEIDKALPKSREYNNLLRDFPIHDLLHAKVCHTLLIFILLEHWIGL
jgi:dynein heavy chain 1